MLPRSLIKLWTQVSLSPSFRRADIFESKNKVVVEPKMQKQDREKERVREQGKWKRRVGGSEKKWRDETRNVKQWYMRGIECVAFARGVAFCTLLRWSTTRSHRDGVVSDRINNQMTDQPAGRPASEAAWRTLFRRERQREKEGEGKREERERPTS